ncbi:MAG: S8/S53 family peptidase [Actinomycetota bacterium]|nr:S8/S53 family peptidase [Actinomycetota bacterium]
MVLDAEGRAHEWFGENHLSFCRDDDEDVISGEAGFLDNGAGHGTFIAGLVLHEAPTARIRMWGAVNNERPRGDDKPGLDTLDDFAVAAAIRALAINPDVVVINLSFGGGVFGEDKPPAELTAALDQVDFDRVAVVAAAGNENSDRKVWPAGFERVLSVGAFDGTRMAPGATPPRAEFSNYGDWVKAYASGVQVLGPFVNFEEVGNLAFPPRPAQPFIGWAQWSGTSFAAATVSGRIAQMAIKNPRMTGADAARALLEEAPKISEQDARLQFPNSAGRAIIL